MTLGRVLTIEALDKKIVSCKKCPRLVSWREEKAELKISQFKEHDYWGKPVPGFGDTKAPIVIVGLAPAANGANRTGRIFTGDKSSTWLHRALFNNKLAKLPDSISRNDGQELYGVRILCAVRCAPPGDKPTKEEEQNCSIYLGKEIELLDETAKVYVALGSLAFGAILKQFKEMGYLIPTPKPKFTHGVPVEVVAPNGHKRTILASYHPSPRNTNTGVLNEKMLDAIFATAKKIASRKGK
jgi:uracil-DNA glycosylase family 4